METNILQLAAATTSASLASVVLGNMVKIVLKKLFGGSAFINSVSEATVSAFILVVCTFEKMLTSSSDFVYYSMTFLYGVMYSRVFLDFSPSPCTPLQKNWPFLNKNFLKVRQQSVSSYFLGLLTSLILYIKVSLPSLFGLVLGYNFGLIWLKFLWNGLMTSHHVNKLDILSDCVDCLNTEVYSGFLVEFGVTLFFLECFSFIDVYYKQHYKHLNEIWTEVIKSYIVCVVLYMFINITGAYGNPFLAFVVQRHCIEGFVQSMPYVLVYFVAPMLATVVHLSVKDLSNVSAKKNE